MTVRLIAITKPVVNDLTTCGQLLAYCARVSNPNNQLNHGTAGKLLKYMTDHQHWSPFEMASATIEVVTTRDIGRQLLRHWSFKFADEDSDEPFRFQEFSQRYAEVAAPLVIREARLQDTNNRQNSIELDGEVDLKNDWLRIQKSVAETCNNAYQWALDSGIAKECARVVLPEGMTPSTMYVTGNLRSWIHYVLLRSGNGTQKEHREIAMQCGLILAKEIPELGEILCEQKVPQPQN